MKSLFLILGVVLTTGFGYAVQPIRKPFTQITVDGKPSKSGDILTVKPGQKLQIVVEMEGGRRDYCKFPDIYADIAGTAQILSRGENGITYKLNGDMAEWKLTSQSTHFDGDEFLQVKTSANPSNAEVTVSSTKFSQSYLKVSAHTSWQFTQNGKTTKEENVAEETLYFKVAGESDVWFSTKNVQAKGIKNEQVQDKLKDVQSVSDSIEANFYKLNFIGVQQAIRNLQNAVNSLKSTIDEVTASNPSYKTKVIFVGLPSDNPFKDLGTFSAIKTSWMAQETMVNDQKLQLGKLPAEATKESRDELLGLISTYVDWQKKLPENSFKILGRYIPDLKEEVIAMPEPVFSVLKEKNIPNYSQTLTELNAFIDQRVPQVPDEIQKISSTQARLQAVRLFDGMLRSYLSSIYWGEWKDTRE
ncbi:MAG TPA: hypothetical protein DCL77_02635 [Prolixibacteraceae bacterium]|jgi:hypothetical protein|nr:hypothetical protein [Prolixibacteraceae bacterium]